jgi:uncharacterized membrane protein
LAVFGIIQIVLAAFALLLIPLLLLGAVISRRAGGGLPAGNSVLNVMTYALLATGLLTLGIGSIRARRWAWALNLTLSWIWLVFGALATVALIAVLPTTFMASFKAAAAASPNAPSMPTGVMALLLTFIIAMCAIFMVVLPIVFVVFYRRQDVEETVKHRDLVERWTDRCPLPVLALSLLFFAGAVYFLFMSFTTPLFPLFGKYLTGLPAGICLLLLAGLDGFVAYSLFRLRLAWWWIAVTVLVLRWASVIVTFRHGDLLNAYARMGWSQQQLQMMSNNPMFRSSTYVYWSAAFGLAFLGYMIWVKRYFTARAIPAPAGPEQPLAAPPA